MNIIAIANALLTAILAIIAAGGVLLAWAAGLLPQLALALAIAAAGAIAINSLWRG